MSLFKVRDFWSLDINHFSKLSAPQDPIEDDEGNSIAKDTANFVVSVGRFNSIGKYDVFVCGGLDGLVCILQVPKNEQPFMAGDENTSRETEMVEDENGFASRQLLVVHQVGFPISDLKCGFYTSALKQSIAILSFDKLVVYQVKKQQADLLSSSPTGLKGSSLDESLFSHKLEEHYRFELFTSEIAANILTVGNHSEGSLTEPNGPDQNSKVNSVNQGKFNKALLLPQRDAIIIQYTNQLIVTFIEHKKIVGHFKLLCPSLHSNAKTTDLKHVEQEYLVQQMAQYVGMMPMAYMKDQSNVSLIVTTSDRKMYCLSLDKMIAQAKQNVMKRIAHTLLQDNTSKASIINRSSALIDDKSIIFKEDNNEKSNIEIELDSFATWKSDLICAPLHIQAIQRCVIGTASSSQLLIMSRYSLDLISGGSGANLWSHRFESPLICFSSYSLDYEENKDNNETEGRGERLISLICADNLSSRKCNLLILEEDQLVWSASLNSRPVQLWRVSLSRIPGALATLDINGARLCISYLGTNLESNEVQLLNLSEEEKEVNDVEVSILETLDKQISTGSQELDSPSKKEKSQKLTFEVRLDASNQWPNVKVNSYISLNPKSTSHRILQNIVVTLEFDDLLNYELTDSFQTTYLSNSTIQVQLGSCWPDCREPIHLSGCFSLRPQASADLCLLPKSLKVNVIVKFYEIYIGTTIQEESFVLPMNLVTQLVHIDYSTGQNQSLTDVQANLHPYKRSGTNEEDQNEPEYYLCDICINDQRGVINLIDEIIESDLICRGINSESKEGISRLLGNNSSLDNLNTMENLDLLAQSLDCRLRYKSPSNKAKNARQTSEEQLPVVVVSIALKIANGPIVLQGIEGDISPSNQNESYSVVWLHLCDLTASGSVIPEEIVKQHSRDWKTFDLEPYKQVEINYNSSTILITIEGDYPIPVLFIYSHVIERLKKRKFNLSNVCLEVYPLSESISDALDIKFSESLKIQNWFAISRNLHDKMIWLLNHYKTALKDKQKQLKEELDKEYYKFHISVMTSISMSKRLYNLPTSMLKQFNCLTSLTKKYQLNLIKLLSELGDLEHLEYHYSKIPNTFNIVIENDDCMELFSSRLAGLIYKK